MTRPIEEKTWRTWKPSIICLMVAWANFYSKVFCVELLRLALNNSWENIHPHKFIFHFLRLRRLERKPRFDDRPWNLFGRVAKQTHNFFRLRYVARYKNTSMMILNHQPFSQSTVLWSLFRSQLQRTPAPDSPFSRGLYHNTFSSLFMSY